MIKLYNSFEEDIIIFDAIIKKIEEKTILNNMENKFLEKYNCTNDIKNINETFKKYFDKYSENWIKIDDKYFIETYNKLNNNNIKALYKFKYFDKLIKKLYKENNTIEYITENIFKKYSNFLNDNKLLKKYIFKTYCKRKIKKYFNEIYDENEASDIKKKWEISDNKCINIYCVKNEKLYCIVCKYKEKNMKLKLKKLTIFKENIKNKNVFFIVMQNNINDINFIDGNMINKNAIEKII